MCYYPSNKLIELNPTQIFVYGTIWTAVWGAIVWFTKDRISTKRDEAKQRRAAQCARDDRKRDFLGFMAEWRMMVIRANPRRLGEDLSQRIEAFSREQTKIRSDFPAGEVRNGFDGVVKSLSSLGKSEVTEAQGNTEVGQIKFTTAIDAVINFVEAN
jgi:hypothetical protein